MGDTTPLTSHSADYRNKIRSRLKHQEAFKQFLAVWVGVAILLISIWFFTTPFRYFWPIWPMLGMSIPAVILWWSAYGTPPKEITDADIDAEIHRIRNQK
ncbi:MAG: hypothetical protein RI985_1284 [Chloroflexota bacterium]